MNDCSRHTLRPLRPALASIAGRHWSRVTGDLLTPWTLVLLRLIPAPTAIERRRVGLAFSEAGLPAPSVWPHAMHAGGCEDERQLAQSVSLADRGLLVLTGVPRSDPALDLVRRMLTESIGPEHLQGPRMVLVNSTVPVAEAIDLGACISLDYEPPAKLNRAMCVGAVRAAAALLEQSWHLLPAGRSEDDKLARLARTFAALDGTTKVVPKHMAEASACLLRLTLE